ncbi:hypothetical protein ABZV93_06285 [Actinopolymorpha sp. NPDC004070]
MPQLVEPIHLVTCFCQEPDALDQLVADLESIAATIEAAGSR